MMKTSFTFSPKAPERNRYLEKQFSMLAKNATRLSVASGEKVFVTMQHSLKTDEFALMVECGRKTFSSHKRMPGAVLFDVNRQIESHVRRLVDEQKSKKKSASRKTRRNRHRRKSTARVRRTRVLQKRRSKSR
jgi:hypothetical protein